MKSLKWLLECMLQQVGMRCDTDTHRDYLSISRRIDHEGTSFLTISLPAFCQSFERSLERGMVDPEDFQGFRRSRALPALMQGLLGQVFDPISGKLLRDPNVEAIASIRQVSLMFKKVNLPCSSYRTRQAYVKFHECEQDLNGLMAALPPEIFETFGKVADVLWCNTLGSLNLNVQSRELLPRHGPGATAERISGNQKYNHKTWHQRLESSFPFDAYGMSKPCADDGREALEAVSFLEPEAEEPVRVITVPKTLKTPRIIAIEPVCMQYTQQSLAPEIMKLIERGRFSRGHVNFRDQRVNRHLALKASEDGTLATLDLSEASDRVHKDLVYRMLGSLPSLREAVFACRSMRADVNGHVVCLNKFASMGSALCFPIESMLFFTVLATARIVRLNLPVTARNVSYVTRSMYVYGDDLLVPVDEVDSICFALNSFGLKVNEHKSFWTGRFRESCGMDAYAGADVTPVYLRTMPPADRHDASEAISYVAFANQLYQRGWWYAARRVREDAERRLRRQLPYVRETSPCLGWHSVDNRYDVHRWDNDQHRFLVKSFVAVPSYSDDPLEGLGALMKYFLSAGELPVLRAKHLERSVRPGCVRIKIRWAPPV
jgi:hypothetical protein